MIKFYTFANIIFLSDTLIKVKQFTKKASSLSSYVIIVSTMIVIVILVIIFSFSIMIFVSVRRHNCFGFWLVYLSLLYQTILLCKKDKNQYQHSIFASIAFESHNLDIAWLSIYCLPIITERKYLHLR